MMKFKRGFTLIEVLIVVLIIGLLAVLVVPRYFGQNERGYVSEAVAMLSAIRQAEVSYYLENAAYTATLASLDIDTSMSTKFTYAGSTTGTSTASRSGGAAAFNGKTIILDIAGAWTGNHPYRPT
jgi:prepilin-type N-terminal cleavage/methylation domain-containing protein